MLRGCRLTDSPAEGRSTVEFTTPRGGPLPERLGPYRVLDRLGEGGMGEVYPRRASRTGKRQIAIKIVRAGMVDRDARARFEAERQALAMMDHAGIAKIHASVIQARRDKQWFALIGFFLVPRSSQTHAMVPKDARGPLPKPGLS